MKRLLTSCFGLGFLPVAPGTWGSLPPAVIFMAISTFTGSPKVNAAIMAVLAILGSVICVVCSPAAITATGKKDPGEVVVDEFAGQSVAYAVILVILSALGGSQLTGQNCVLAAGGFALFRLFDILKPAPCRLLEKLPSGWGILADDLMAGLYAGAATALLMKLANAYNAGMEL